MPCLTLLLSPDPRAPSAPSDAAPPLAIEDDRSLSAGLESDEESTTEEDPVFEGDKQVAVDEAETPCVQPPASARNDAQVINSRTHKLAYQRLGRLVNNPARIKNFPDLKKLFLDPAHSNEVLREWVHTGEDAAAVQATCEMIVSSEVQNKRIMEPLTVKEMRAKGFSEQLACTLQNPFSFLLMRPSACFAP